MTVDYYMYLMWYMWACLHLRHDKLGTNITVVPNEQLYWSSIYYLVQRLTI